MSTAEPQGTFPTVDFEGQWPVLPAVPRNNNVSYNTLRARELYVETDKRIIAAAGTEGLKFYYTDRFLSDGEMTMDDAKVLSQAAEFFGTSNMRIYARQGYVLAVGRIDTLQGWRYYVLNQTSQEVARLRRVYDAKRRAVREQRSDRIELAKSVIWLVMKVSIVILMFVGPGLLAWLFSPGWAFLYCFMPIYAVIAIEMFD